MAHVQPPDSARFVHLLHDDPTDSATQADWHLLFELKGHDADRPLSYQPTGKAPGFSLRKKHGER